MAYTLANLQTDVRNYTETTSTVLTDSILNGFIVNAENKIYRAIDTDQSAFYATSSLVVGNRYVTIPSDLRAIRYVQLTDSAGNQFYVEQRDTSFIAEFYANPGSASVDIPRYYANWDENFWVVAPTPDKTYSITLAYNKEPTSLTSTTLPDSTNPYSTTGTYLSNKYQDLILYATLVNAYGYLKGPVDMLQYYSQEYEKSLESYAVEQIGERRRDEYQDGEIRAQLISKSPSSNK
jgi:hypothetical protein|tara:strand:- start:12 stop:719 length:708 start_codon:yes stop_codon:yes gene_type:complete